MSSTETQICDWLLAHRPDMVAFCQRLIRTPSVNGVDDEAHVARVIAEEAERWDLPVQIMGEFPHRPNIIVSTQDEGETGLLILGHLDTVPPGDPATWTHPPFAAVIDGERLYGRGAIDTKGGMAAAIYTLAALKAHPQALGPGIRAQFIGVPDEETGATGTLGIRYLAARGLIRAKGAIYAYSGSEIILGHRGLLRYRLRCTGKAIHTGSHEWQEKTAGANAITGMARLLLALEAVPFSRSTAPYFETFRTVVTPGTMIEGGVSINIVPPSCEALVDVRTTPGDDAPAMEALFDREIGRITAAAPGLAFSYERLNEIPASISDPAATLFHVLADATREVRGVIPSMTVAGPANEGYLLIEQGIPTVCGFGPTGANAHADDEYVELKGLVEAAQIFALTAIRI
ncbi:MAG: M20/M25/M40 family metallo-hydrolase [Chloroflexi bacterium]|nr:M20/M25/M40 family metallo-hydrolase [Chloroflexota bacterium]